MSRLRSALGLAALVSSFAPFAAAQTKAAPQLLPYTITAVAGGGPVTGVVSPTAPLITTTYTANAFTVGQSCANGSTLTATDTYGDGCLATQVGLVLPYSVAADAQGNVILIDGSHALIRRVDARTGIITSIAGQGASAPAAGSTCGAYTSTSALGDGCPATLVKLASPEALAFDPSGNLWFSDFALGSVRRIDRVTGVITTPVNAAGTPGYKAEGLANPGVSVLAAAGQLYRPYGITFDRAGNLYIADNYNNSVEAVNFQSTATSIAGISIAAGHIYTIAGAGCPIGTSPGCSTAAYYGKTGGQSPNSTLDSPYQVAVDNANNIYIADEFPYDIRVISGATGILSTYANTGFTKSAVQVRGPANLTSLASTTGVATDAAGNVYLTTYDTATAAPTATSGTGSSYLHRIDVATGGLYPLAGQFVKAVPAGGPANTANATAVYCAAETDNIGDGCPGTQATLYSPFQPFVDAAGNVLFVDQKNLLIRKLSVNTQFPATATGKSVTQNLLVHYGAADTQGTYTLPTPGGFGAVDFTLGTAVCTVNTDTTQDCVLPVTFTPTGAGLRTASLTVKSLGGLTSTFALTGTGNAALLLTDSTSNTGAGTLGNGPFPAIAALAGDTAGYLYAAVPSATGIRKFTSNVSGSTTIGTAANAVAVTTDPSGNVFAALSTGTVVEIPANGAAQITLGTGFTAPSGLAADAFGNVFIADSSANTVTRIAAGSLIQTVVATGLNGPTGLAVDTLGNVFVANTVANNVVEVPVTGAANLTLGTGLAAPRAVATDASGALYVADTRNARVVFIPNENGTLTSADQLTVATLGLTTPTGVVVTSSGILYVADSTANAIYSYNRTAATQAFGNDAIGTQLTAAADLISAGNLPVNLATPYYTAAGNTADFTLTPTALTSGTTLAPGFGVALTAGFKPTATGTRTATYTVNGTVLTLTGAGITPVNATTTTLAATPTSGTYGATIALTITVATGTGKPAATGTVTVKVDTTTYTPTLSATGVATLSLPGLSAGAHTITSSYPGDTTSSPSTATPITVTLAQAPLTVTPNAATKQYLAALPTFTGTFTGVVNNDSIGVTYTTTATATSPIGTYPISATVTGTAASNYAVTVTPGVLTVTKAGTTTLLSVSSTAVSASTPVTLTATVSSATTGVPTGLVSFYNGSTLIATVAVSATGVATTSTTFTVTGQSSTNVITAVYSGDTNYTTSTSSAVTVLASTPGFNLTGVPTSASVVQGQTALLNFSVTPTFAYAGTITASCSNLPATVNCVFFPASLTVTGANTANLIALSLTTVQPGGLAANTPPATLGSTGSKLAFALLPGFVLLAGVATRRRKLLSRILLLLAFTATLGTLSGCGTGHTATPTPTGTYNVTVTLTGTPSAAAPTTNITSSFNVALTVTGK